MADIRYSSLLLSRRGFLAASSAGLATLALPRSTRAQSADTLTYALSAYPPGMDPFRYEGAAATAAKLQVYRGLLSLDTDGQIVGELAESWDQSGTEYVFRLRENAMFHNGEPVTAADVVWSFEQMTKEGSTAYFVEDFEVISSVVATDDRTVRFTLSEPTPAFAKFLATPYCPVISAKAGQEQPVGAGPYRITAEEEGVSIEFEAFEGFYKKGLPKTKRLKMVVYKDESLRVAALETGDVDIIEYVPWQSMGQVEGNAGLVLQETTGPSMVINFNVEQPPFDDPRVRQAVCYAIKREDIVNTAFYGRGKPLLGLPLDENSEIASEKTDKLFDYDPDKAKALLEEAGALGKKVTLLSSATYSVHQDTALVVQQYLNAVGLQCELALPEWGARVTQGNEGKYQFCINGSSTVVNDPDGLTALIGSGSPTYKRSWGYSNAKLDALLTEGRHELDPSRRKTIYEEVAQLFKEDVPLCPLTRRTQGFGLKKNVEGFTSLVGSSNSLSPITLEATLLV
ncbi:ABC transporter substrate-binding protein [Paracoccus pantotrophus]|uniref:ABC transporter substrate-binding protein n=1 Tax=Paracoccus pantotrophus TaxID=82367 RepID=UPI0008F3991C|nr:ABC transporter substrate-binding protein [Paracoccus pantotrophus]MDF3855773.1 ABC transporter substrate-binding protein [Paracoccus pantotrophus]SFP25294.1 peptide/nickel transport system substrate-binding protein [Paracoccus pantotrophus]